MRFQLKRVILWPKSESLLPRVVEFEVGKLNVISGVSRTGKSAIIPIIDYCLGADKCAIPTGVIRDKTAWFGVVVTTSAGEMLFARREPGNQQATDDMYFHAAPEITTPPAIQKNTTKASVKQKLDHLAGLTKLDFSVDDDSNARLGRPSFRDMAAFTFQPQNIVANPDVLFYKADTVEHRLKLRAVFPYVLGAVSIEVLAVQHELAQLSRDLRRRSAELDNLRRLSIRWQATMDALYLEAKDLGLANRWDSKPQNRDETFRRLREISRVEKPDQSVSGSLIDDSAVELARLSDEEAELSDSLSLLQRRYSEIDRLKKGASQYQSALGRQKERLELSRWLVQNGEHSHDCPVCGNDFKNAGESVRGLLTALSTVETTTARVETAQPAFDREAERIRRAISEETERLHGVQIRRNALTSRSMDARRERYGQLNAARFLGRLEADLRMLDNVGDGGSLADEVDALKARVTELEAFVSQENIAKRTRRALEFVDLNAGRLIPLLDAEEPDAPIHLSETELTIKVQHQKRDDFLWEIGSGSNWVSYHVAMTLGLQQFFMAQEQCPVPSFLVYDQPSQVYFPRKLAVRPGEDLPEIELSEPDIIAVRKIYDVIEQVIDASSGKLQVIVLDHAAESVWGEVPSINVVDTWRDGRALIPEEWLK